MDRHLFDADPDPNSMLMPIRIRIVIKAMPIHMQNADPTLSFAYVGQFFLTLIYGNASYH